MRLRPARMRERKTGPGCPPRPLGGSLRYLSTSTCPGIEPQCRRIEAMATMRWPQCCVRGCVDGPIGQWAMGHMGQTCDAKAATLPPPPPGGPHPGSHPGSHPETC
eukprot:233256-Alexandrium_andersonii.AAC.1